VDRVGRVVKFSRVNNSSLTPLILFSSILKSMKNSSVMNNYNCSGFFLVQTSFPTFFLFLFFYDAGWKCIPAQLSTLVTRLLPSSIQKREFYPLSLSITLSTFPPSPDNSQPIFSSPLYSGCRSLLRRKIFSSDH